MTNYARIEVDSLGNEKQLREASGQNDNVLSRSLRGGIYGAGSQLLSAGGAVADAVDADGVGSYLHGQSKGLRSEAELAGNSPRVGSYSQLRDNFSMDNLGEYVGGLVGGSLPMTAAGIAGGIATGGAGFVPALLGAGAATLPFNVGEVVQRQQTDPQALQQGAGQRLGEAVLGGAGASAIESLVPGLVGRQILGKGVGNLAKESVKQMVGRNAMDIPLEGLTEGAGTAVKQYAANQETPLDWNEIKEGAIGGAAAGTVFSGVGTAADLAHSVAPKTGEMLNEARTSIRDRLSAAKGKFDEKVDTAAATAPGKKVASVFDDIQDMVTRGTEKAKDTFDKVMKDEDLGIDPKEMATASAERVKEMFDFSDNEKVKAATQWGKDLLSKLHPKHPKRADVEKADPTTREGQVLLASVMKEQGADDKAGSLIDALADQLDITKVTDVEAKAPAAPAPEMTMKERSAARKAFISDAIDKGMTPEAAREAYTASLTPGPRAEFPDSTEIPKLSADYSGAHGVIIGALEKDGLMQRLPQLSRQTPQRMIDLVSGLRVMFERMGKGTATEENLAHFNRLLEGEAPRLFTALQRELAPDMDAATSNRFFSNVRRMKKAGEESQSLLNLMRTNMTDEGIADGLDSRVDEYAQVLMRHARGELGSEGSAKRQLAEDNINEFYTRVFGDKADVIMEAVQERAGMDKARLQDNAERLDENGAVVEGSEGGFDEGGNRLSPSTKDTQTFGLTKPDKAGNSKSQLNGIAMHKDDRYVQQHILDLRKEAEPGGKRNPYAEVDSNGDYLYDIRFEALPGSEFGHIRVEKVDNSTEFNQTDLENMKHDTHAYPDSKSRIDIGDMAIDAVKVARVARTKMQETETGGPATTKAQRLVEGFKYGISLLTTQFGERIVPSDDAIIGYIGGKPLTWGAAQKLDVRTHKDMKADFLSQEIAELKKEVNQAVAANADPEVVQELVDSYKELVAEQRKALAIEQTSSEDYQGRSLPRQRPSTRTSEDAMDSGNEYVGTYDAATRAAMEAKGGSPRTASARAQPRGVYPAASIEFDPEDETGTSRSVVRPANINGEMQDENGTRAKDKEGNIHALGDRAKPAFGGNDKNRVTRKPWGTVDQQNDPQVPAKVKTNAKAIRDKREDLKANEDIIHRSNMDGSGHYVNPNNMPRNNLVAAVQAWDGESSAGAAKLKARAQTLLNNFDVMSEADQRRMVAIAPEDMKAVRGLKAKKFVPVTMAEARDVINALAGKYAAQIARAPAPESVKGTKGAVYERNPVQFYNDGKAGVRGPEKATEAPKKVLMVDAIAKRQDYLNNPPEDYSPEKVKGILDWAMTQQERVDSEVVKLEGMMDDPAFDQDRYDALDARQGELRQLAKVAKAMIQNEKDMAEADIKNGTNLFGGNPDPKSVAAKSAASSGNKASLEATDPNKTAGPNRRLTVEQHIEKVLGKSVRVLWQSFTHAGQYTHTLGKGLVELSVHALDPMSVAHHESLHAFFAQLRDAGAVDITRVLTKAANSEHVMAQLTERFKNQPAVLAQLKDPEERAAYMYQMWAADPSFKVSIAAKTVLQKVAALIRKTLGIWSNDERALHIMEYFNSGKYAANIGHPNAVRRALMETGTNRAVETAKGFTQPLGHLADALISSGDGRLRDMDLPSMTRLADIIKRPGTQEGGDQGFIPAARIAATKRLGAMAAALEGYTPEQLNEALEALQTGSTAPSAEGRLAVRVVKGILADTKAYMEAAGVKLGDLGPDYFPRVWDPHFISQNEAAMQAMLQPYVRSGEFKGNPTDFIRSLTSREGNEFGIESRRPGMQHAKKRDLAFLKNDDVAPFLNKDLMGTLASYIGQATRRAEWERRLGNNRLEILLETARAEGATDDQMVTVEEYLKGVDGTLGDDLNPNARRIMGNLIVYQNVRLLPMAMFSMLVDPMGTLVRGGTISDAWTTFKRGIKSIPVTYGKKDIGDEATRLAELVGVVDNAMLVSVMGDVYTQGMVGGTAKKINDTFFKYNMVEGLNRAFRVGASEAAMKFIARHADGKESTHSKRWMAELGLKAGDIQMVSGRIALTTAEGLTEAQAKRVHAAVNQWVDGAMLRPDAADKPIWMNDPHWALISHLKQFVFSFQKVILGRMAHELRHGNYVPAMALASYVPVMIAADATKGMIQGGGDVPEWKKNWGPAEYVGYGVQRAGLFGVGQFGVDMVEDVNRGGSGFGALSGPTLEQMADVVQLMGGNKQFGPMLMDAMPANALYKESIGGSTDEGDTPKR
jgi:hypothetical protein